MIILIHLLFFQFIPFGTQTPLSFNLTRISSPLVLPDFTISLSVTVFCPLLPYPPPLPKPAKVASHKVVLRTPNNSIRKVSHGFSAGSDVIQVDYSSICTSASRSERECTAGKSIRLRDFYQVLEKRK